MALKFDATETAVYTTPAVTGTYYGTIGYWYRHPGTFSGVDYLSRQFGGIVANTSADGIRLVSDAPTTEYNASSGTWSYIGVVSTNTTVTLYCWDDTATSTPTTVVVRASGGVTAAIGFARDSYSYAQVGAEYLHLRYWAHSTSAASLSAAALNSERLSATPVLTTNLLQWSDLTADLAADGGYGSTLTAYNSGNQSFTANVPTMLTASSSVMPGIIRPRQQFAFSSAIARHS
jgi:hypothetical protein